MPLVFILNLLHTGTHRIRPLLVRVAVSSMRTEGQREKLKKIMVLQQLPIPVVHQLNSLLSIKLNAFEPLSGGIQGNQALK